MPTPSGAHRRLLGRVASAIAAVAVLSAAACGTGPADTPRITPGTSDQPRTVIMIARDYTFEPPVVDLVPGETVLVQVVNGGLVTHEAVVGPLPVQDAWEAAEAPTASAPPGPTPQVSVEPGLAGLRVVVSSGERKDITWTVPAAAASDPGGWFVGCHIPGHWARGMVVPVRFVGSDGLPLATLAAASGDTLRTARREGRSAASR
ncbi:MAG TPA: hypothetical protein VFV53_06855 [Candidatus Limnocylindrales bacterium]|nr:hypothetical protein [Candidatus Limnocylindrales bacterium]